jgi:hypothetical protein
MANSLNEDLRGKVVLIKADYLKPEITDRRFQVDEDGGFGAVSFTNGTALFGKWLSDNERDRLDGYMVESIVE